MRDSFGQGCLGRLVAQILSWTAVQRCALFCVLMLVLTLQYCVWGITVYYWPPAYDDVNRDVIAQIIPYAIFLTIGLSGLYLACRYFGHSKNTTLQLGLQLAVACFYAMDMSFFCYFIGSMSMSAGVVLMGAPVFGLMLIDRRAVYMLVILGGTIVLLVSVLALYGVLPYAPLLIYAGKNGFISPFLFWSILFFLLPYLLMLVVFFDVFMSSLRSREAEVRYLSEHDPLTGLYNRRSLNARVEQWLQDANRQQQQLAVVLLDLDHFKQINDTYGHLSGDQVLIAAAKVIESQVRKVDLVGRFGGEEFIVVLPHTSVAEAQQVAERIRVGLMALELLSEDGVVFSVHGSLGVVCGSIAQQTSWRDMLQAADQALYQAKQWGRNQVVLYQDRLLITTEQVLH
jgi:diguanylate cyclase (GGDEF)-like protein